MYPCVDIEKTGLKLKIMIKLAGYDVKFIQEYLHLSCPQSIYKWFRGKSLPSVENLYALSLLLGVHMEDLLVQKEQQSLLDKAGAGWRSVEDARVMRLLYYCDGICKAA